jgi:2-phosphosulfolactate phosphatase
MLGEPWEQTRYAVRFDWGPTGAARVGGREGVLVVVDVLSFTTAVDIAVERGSAVYPAACRDADAARLARDVGGVLAVDRREVTERHPWSLSPAALRAAPVASRLVLPSPNGAAIAAAAAQPVVVAASLRNAGAVAAWLVGQGRGDAEPITVVAAGERWPDGSLRPALEDLLGAGAVLAALAAQRAGTESPEAASARAAYESTRSVADAIRRCASGVELVGAGFADDVDIALDADASDVVPVRRDGSFQSA